MLSSKGPMLSTTIMRAIVVSKFGDPDVLELRRDVPIPVPGPDEVLVKVGAVGINPVDTYIRSGNYARLPKLPYIPGNDVAGVITVAGSNVKRFNEGDRVASFMHVKSGGYAEYCVVHKDWLVRLPDKYDLRKGAAIGTPYFTAYRALFQKGNTKPGDLVLIHGASGGVGMAAIQLAASRGIMVIGTAGSPEGVEAVKNQGVANVFNHKEEGYTKLIQKCMNGRSPDCILEMLSNVNLNIDLELLAQNGRVIVIGCRGKIDINPRLMMGKETSIQGVGLFAATKEEFAESTKVISAGLHLGYINPVVGVEMSLNSIQKAHADIILNTGAKGKMVAIV